MAEIKLNKRKSDLRRGNRSTKGTGKNPEKNAIFKEMLKEKIEGKNEMTGKEMLIAAGYSPRSSFGSMLRSVGVQKFLEKIGASKADRIVKLAEFMHEAKPKESIAAIQELNKMQGDYSPQQITLIGKMQEDREKAFDE